MHTLFRLCADPGIVRIIAMIISGVFSGGVITYFWSNSKRSGIRMTNIQWVIIWGFGAIAFLSASLTLGFLIVPKNSDGLLELLRLDRTVNEYTRVVQGVLLWFIALMM